MHHNTEQGKQWKRVENSKVTQGSEVTPFYGTCLMTSKPCETFRTDQSRYSESLQTWEQPPRDVRSKRCSENMQQIYRRSSMPKYDCKALWRGCSPVNMLHIFRTNFAKNTSGRLLLKHLPWNFWEKQLETLIESR